MKHLKTVILAAGKGTRLQQEGIDLPKAMRPALGTPLLGHVINALPEGGGEDIVIVVGYMKEKIMEAFPGYTFAYQDEQLGTGHAVMCAAHALEGWEGDVLISYGDMPLVKKETYAALLKAHKDGGNACTILAGTSPEDLPYGRIVRDENGGFLRIVEDRDCTPEEKKIRELNAGIYVFRAVALLPALKELKNDNAQSEYYLTDVPDIIAFHGGKVGVCVREMGAELIGVNTPQQLEMVERELNARGD